MERKLIGRRKEEIGRDLVDWIVIIFVGATQPVAVV